ncbi:MAG: hypothetical protein ACOCW1_00620 [Chitinispirillaceae bacterium]
MKKIIFLISITALLSSNAMADAIGLRLGGGPFGGNAEVTYQKPLSSSNRIEVDLGWGGGIGIAGLYHWRWNITNGLNWYAGPGAQLSLWDGGMNLSVGGQIGIEYNFNTTGVPILLSLDTRPMIGLLSGGGFGYDGALSIRYTF